MRHTLAIVLALLFGVTTWAQNPPYLSFILAGKGGQTQFRMGETITLEMRFDSSAAGLYELYNQPNIFTSHFTGNPSDGIADLAPQHGPGCCGGIGPPIPLGGKSGIIQIELNTSLAFRKPGHYRITADYDGIAAAGLKAYPKVNERITVRSSALEIEIVDDPAWSQAELQKDVAAIEARDPTEAWGRGNRKVIEDASTAAHKMSLLDTHDSAMAMVSLFSQNLDSQVRNDMEKGLRRSPYPKEIIAAMEKAIDAPDTPITNGFLDTLYSLIAVTNSNPPDFAKSYAAVYQKLSQALSKKQGDALTVSRETMADYNAHKK